MELNSALTMTLPLHSGEVMATTHAQGRCGLLRQSTGKPHPPRTNPEKNEACHHGVERRCSWVVDEPGRDARAEAHQPWTNAVA